MKRRGFLRGLLGSLAAAPVVPKLDMRPPDYERPKVELKTPTWPTQGPVTPVCVTSAFTAASNWRPVAFNDTKGGLDVTWRGDLAVSHRNLAGKLRND